MTDRRNFLQTGALAIVGAAALGASGKVFGKLLPTDRLSFAGAPALTRGHFESLVNTTFRIKNQQNGNRAALKLIQVKETAHAAKSANGRAGRFYSLLFQGNEKHGIQQGIHSFSHDTAQEFSFFVSPVTPDPNLFEVIMDRSAG